MTSLAGSRDGSSPTDPGPKPERTSAPDGARGRARSQPGQNLRLARKTRTRQIIEATAFALFTQEPYDRVTVRRIAAAAGVTTGAVFHQFETKAHIWRAVMGTAPPVDHPAKRSVGEIEAALQALVAAYRDGDGDALARALSQAEAVLERLPPDTALPARRGGVCGRDA